MILSINLYACVFKAKSILQLRIKRANSMVQPTLVAAAAAVTLLLSASGEASTAGPISLCSSLAFVSDYCQRLPEQSQSSHRINLIVRNLSQIEVATDQQSQDDASDRDPWQYNGPNHQGNVAINRLAEKAARGDKTAAARAEDVLRSLEEQGAADTISYNGVIKAYAKSKSKLAVRRAESVLDRMELSYERLLKQDGQAMLAEMVKPNIRSYSTLLDAYSRNPQMKTTEESEELLDRVRRRYEETDDPDLAVNVYAVNSVLHHWSKSNRGVEGAIGATDLLNRMKEEGLVDTISYNSVIDAWARSGAGDSGAKAESILRKMQSKAEEDVTWAAATDYDARAPPRPNVRTYCCVIDAWSASNDPSATEHASALLTELERKYEETRDEELRPNEFAYGACLNAYSRSEHPDKAFSALKLLKRMKELWRSGKNISARPNIVHYNTVLNAFATMSRHGESGSSVDTLDRAMDIVRALYDEIIAEGSSVRPDDFTHGTVLKACANLLPTRGEGASFIASIFHKCCQDGQVTFQVCFLLKQAASYELLEELLPKEAYDPRTQRFDVEKMPESWRRNVLERRNRKLAKNK